mgnify:CR=1 FL=1
MGIWIRSQDGCVLCNANTIWIEDEDVLANKGSIPTWLGEYACEAEAMQVMDMIQEHITKGRGQMEDYGDGRTIVSDVVFQMPEAGFLGGADDDRS